MNNELLTGDHIGSKSHTYLISKVSDLVPYASNSRTHSDEQVQQIADSISEFGITNPILIDGDGNIIAGHGRVLAMNLLGIQETPSIRMCGLDKAQLKALVIADNKLSLNAGWNMDVLISEIEELKELNFDIDLLGFSDKEMDRMLNDLNDSMPDIGAGESDNTDFKIQVKGPELEYDDVLATIERAIRESGIEGVVIK